MEKSLQYRKSGKLTEVFPSKKIVILALVLVIALVPFALAFSVQEGQGASTWIIKTVDSAGDVGFATSIALDSHGYVRISYFDESHADLKYAYWTGASWGVQTVDSTGDVGYFTDLAFDSNDNPHISYYDDTTDDLKHAKWTGLEWSIQTVDFGSNVGLYTSIALDSGDNPHISYYDGTNEDLKYAKWTGSMWNIQTVASAGDVGWDTSIALDSSNNPHISYLDYTNGNLKYAFLTDADFSLSVNPYDQTVAAGGSTAHTVAATLISGIPGTVTLSIVDLPSGSTYVFTPPTGGAPFTSKLIITIPNTASPGGYDPTVIATSTSGVIKQFQLELNIYSSPTLTLNLSPQPVARGSPITISGQLTPGQAATIQLHYKYPHVSGTWKLATTLTTNNAGAYSAVATVPTSLPPGTYDLMASWYNGVTGAYASSPVTLFTVT